jgi:hypothetical protein
LALGGEQLPLRQVHLVEHREVEVRDAQQSK